MASNINTTNIDITYPIAGQDNDSQGFRDNFTNINTNFVEAKSEIEALQVDFLNTVIDHGNVADPTAINVAAAPYQKITPTEPISIVFSNFTAGSTHSLVQVEINITSVTNTVTLPAEVTIGLAGIQGISGQVITFPSTGIYILEFASADGVTISVHDLTPTGLSSGIAAVSDDPAPELGGNLNVAGNIITSVGGANVAITPDTSGSIVLDGQTWPNANAGVDGYVLSSTTLGVLSWVATSSAVSDDPAPELGGNLNVAGNSIVSASAGDIAITPDTTGSIVLDGLKWPQADGTADYVLKTDGLGQLSWVAQAAGGGGNWIVGNAGGDFITAPIATGTNSIAIGNAAESSGAVPDNNIAIGSGASAYKTQNVAIGFGASASNGNAVAIGTAASAFQVSATAIGVDSSAGASGVGIGNNAEGGTGVAIGIDAIVGSGGTNSVAIGRGATSDSVYQVVVGRGITNVSVPSVNYSALVGYGIADVNQNVLYLHDKGKLELVGDEAQFVIPSYTTAEIAVPLAGLTGGLVYNSTTDILNTFDGTVWNEIGGSLAADPAPILAGDLDVAGNSIISAAGSNGDITIAPDGTGAIILSGQSWPTSIGTDGYVLSTDAVGNLTWVAQSGGSSVEPATSYGTAGAVALNTSTGTYFYPSGTTTGVITFSFTAPATTGNVTAFTMELLGAGNNAPVWPAGVQWPGSTEPTWTTGLDIVSFVTRNNGSTWVGMTGGLNFG